MKPLEESAVQPFRAETMLPGPGAWIFGIPRSTRWNGIEDGRSPFIDNRPVLEQDIWAMRHAQ